MRYRNQATGAVIELEGILTGGGWELVAASQEKQEAKKPQTRKRQVKKNG